MRTILIAALGSVLAIPAFAADLPVKARPMPVAVPACDWCGFYAGLNAGWVGADNRVSTASTPVADAVLGLPAGVTAGLSALSTVSFPVGRANGFIGGAQVGYNWQAGKFLAGVEADIQGLSNTGSSATLTSTALVVGPAVTSTQTASMSTSYLGTLRGRVGMIAAPSWLLYLTGGLAYGGVKVSDTLFQTGTNGFIGAGAGSLSDTRVGWTLGFGSEWKFAPNWSVKAEYLHYDLGTANLTTTAAATAASTQFPGQVFQTNVTSARFQGDIVRAGINYHFGGPVVARY